MFPPGWKSLNLSLEKLSLCIKAIAKQSPNNNEILVEVVGTISVGSDSTTVGNKILTSLAFSKTLFFLQQHQ